MFLPFAQAVTMIKYILYVSEVSENCGDKETADILRTSRTNNARNAVTGMLVRKNRQFLQYIEGPEQGIEELYTKIERDTRHNSVKIIEEGLAEDRVFYDWEMGFADEHNFQPLQWKWQLDKISLFSLAEDAAHCLDFVKEFMGTPALAANTPSA